MRILALQTGARRGYAIPRLLEEAGLLERFYTDLAGNAGFGRCLAAAGVLPFLRPAVNRLRKREIPATVLPKTRTFAGPVIRDFLRKQITPNDSETAFKHSLAFSDDLASAMVRAGFGGATHVYAMLNEAGDFLSEARRRGLFVISEVYILLSTERILTREQADYPDWEPRFPDFNDLRDRYLPNDIYPRDIDLCLCPSEAVRDDLIANWGVSPGRTALVPYGMDPRWLELEAKPEPGRILFVGTADLRKGIHYLAAASNRLREAGRNYEFRIAGNVSDTVRNHPECRNLTFLGRVPRDRIHEEFQRADLFVLPSLAEGSAEVTYEALAAGLPQIVTRATGSVARDGIDGIVVPERDPAALAGAIERAVTDRSWRNEAARVSRERGRGYTWEQYGKRLVEVLTAFQTNKR